MLCFEITEYKVREPMVLGYDVVFNECVFIVRKKFNTIHGLRRYLNKWSGMLNCINYDENTKIALISLNMEHHLVNTFLRVNIGNEWRNTL